MLPKTIDLTAPIKDSVAKANVTFHMRISPADASGNCDDRVVSVTVPRSTVVMFHKENWFDSVATSSINSPQAECHSEK